MDWLTGKRDGIRKLISQLGIPTRREATSLELLRIGPTAVDGLVEAMAGKDASLHEPAASLLIRMGSSAIPPLSQLLATAHPEIRGHAADILGEIRHAVALPFLIEAAHGEFFTVRAHAATALGKIGDPQAVPILIDLLSDVEPVVRIAAALALGPFKDQASLLRLSDLLLEDHELEVRQAAAQALAATCLPGAIPYLIDALSDSFWWYERESGVIPLLEALESLGAQAVEPLIDALTLPEGTVRRNAAQVLGRIKDPRAIEPLGLALYDLHLEVGDTAAEALSGFGGEALEVLPHALKHPEAGIRMHAIRALSRIKDARVLPLLTGMLQDPDPQVLKYVILSLGETRDLNALPILTSIADDRAHRELSIIARQAINTLQR